jgi:hypothetical protein
MHEWQCKFKWGWGIYVFSHLRQTILRARNLKGKIPGAGRRVQCGAQPGEASKTLTRRPATHNHAPDSRARPHATADWLRTFGRMIAGNQLAAYAADDV